MARVEGVVGVFKVCRVFLVTDTAQVELRSGRVQAPAAVVDSAVAQGAAAHGAAAPGTAAAAAAASASRAAAVAACPTSNTAAKQGLTLVRFSAQCKHFLWERECISGLLRVHVGVA
jgi:hypothetical protein